MLIVNQNRPNWGIILRITLALMAAILPPAASQCGCTECTSQDAVAASDTLELRMICEDGEIFLDYFSVESDSDVDVIFQDPYDGLYWTAFGSTSSRCHSFDDFDFSNAVSPADYGVSILIECNNLFFDCMVNYGGRLLCIDPSTNLTLPSATPQPSRTYPPSPSSAPSTVPTTQPSAPVPRYNTDMRVYFPKGDSEQCVKNELLDFYSAPCTSVVALCPYPFGDNTSVPCSDLKEWYECIDSTCSSEFASCIECKLTALGTVIIVVIVLCVVAVIGGGVFLLVKCCRRNKSISSEPVVVVPTPQKSSPKKSSDAGENRRQTTTFGAGFV